MTTEFFPSQEIKTIRTSTYQAVSLFGVLIILISFYLAVTQLEFFPFWQAVLVFVNLPLLLPLIYLRKRLIGAGTSMVAQGIVVLSASFSAAESDARLSASTLIFIWSYFGIVVLPKKFQIPWIAIASAVWIQIVPGVALHSVVFGDSINLRWGTLIQLVISSFAIRYVWNFEWSSMVTRTEELKNFESEFTEAVVKQQRLQSWRTSLNRMHETLLNDIRSVIDSKSINGSRLQDQLVLEDPFLQRPPTSKLALRSTLLSLQPRLDEFSSVVFEQIPSLSFVYETSQLLKNVLLEICRNRYRHSGAKNLRIRAVKTSNDLVIRIADDGSSVGAESYDLGVGRGVVINEGIRQLRGELNETAGMTVLRIPLPADFPLGTKLPPFNGRAVLAVGMAGNAVGGGLIFSSLTLSPIASEAALGWLGLAVAVIAGWSAWHRVVSSFFIAVAGIAAGVAPLYALQSSRIVQCSDLEINLMGATLISIAMSSLVVWVTKKVWWLAIAPAALSMIWLSLNVVGLCADSVNPPLVAALTPPIMVSMVAYSLHQTALQVKAEKTAELEQIKQMATTSALEEFSLRLDTYIEMARGTLLEVAGSGKLSRKHRQELMLLDGAIRAVVQVDPVTAGAFSILAESVVLKAAESQIPVRVLVLKDSGDKTPLPGYVEQRILDLILNSNGTATIQILSNSNNDTLTVVVEKISSDLIWNDFWMESFENGSLSFNRGTKKDPHLLILKRKTTSK